MTFSTISSIVAGSVFAVSAGWYVIDVAKRKVVVSLATFLVLNIINFSQLASLIAKGVWLVVPFTLVAAVANLLIIVLALRNRKIHFDLLDKVALVGALLGLAVWFITNNAALNLYIISVVNVVTFMPLIVKSFREPDTETIKPWRLNLVASTFLLLTINSASPFVWIVPVRQFACSLLLNIGLYRGAKRAYG